MSSKRAEMSKTNSETGGERRALCASFSQRMVKEGEAIFATFFPLSTPGGTTPGGTTPTGGPHLRRYTYGRTTPTEVHLRRYNTLRYERLTTPEV